MVLVAWVLTVVASVVPKVVAEKVDRMAATEGLEARQAAASLVEETAEPRAGVAWPAVRAATSAAQVGSAANQAGLVRAAVAVPWAGRVGATAVLVGTAAG